MRTATVVLRCVKVKLMWKFITSVKHTLKAVLRVLDLNRFADHMASKQKVDHPQVGGGERNGRSHHLHA